MVTIDAADTATVTKDWSKRFFPYPHNRLYRVTAGHARILLADKRVLSLTPGNIYLLPAFRMKLASCRDTMTHQYVHFSFTSPLLNARLIHHERLVLKADRSAEGLFTRILTSQNERSIGSALAASGALMTLLAPFFADVPLSADTRFDPVLSYIESHLADDISVSDLAAIIPLGTNYFSNLFTDHFGMAPKQYIVRRRIAAACSMLAHTAKRVNEIARAAGFKSDVHFSRTFHSIMRISPGEYRRCCSRR